MKKGWEIKKLGEVCDQITDGSHFSPKSYNEGEYPYITVRDINNDIVDFENCKFINRNDYELLFKNGCKPNNGDLLFSKDGTVGKVSLVNYDKDFVVLSSIAIIRPKRNVILSTLLKYILKDSEFLQKATGMKTGVAIRRIILKHLKLIEISFPQSLSEQQQIVSILDEAFAAIDQAKANLQRNLQNAKELFQSELNSIFTNKGEGWVEKKLGECFKLSSGYMLTAKMMKEGKYPVYGGNGISGFHSEFNLSGSNVIIGRVGALCGNVRNINEEIWLTDNAFQVTDFNYDFDNAFLTYLLNYKDLRSLARQSAQPVISNSSLKDLLLQFPISLKVQQKIVQQLDALSLQTKQLEANYQQQLNNLEDLKKSVLQKAFSGELTNKMATA